MPTASHSSGRAGCSASRFPKRVAGIDLLGALLAAMEREGLSAYFLGAREEVLRTAVTRIAERSPAFARGRVSITVISRPTRMEPSLPRSVTTAPDALFVGMSSPRKEHWIDAWQPLTGARFAMGVGGSFDVISGLTKRAPAPAAATRARVGLPHRTGAPASRGPLCEDERRLRQARRRGTRSEAQANSAEGGHDRRHRRSCTSSARGRTSSRWRPSSPRCARACRMPITCIVHTGQHYDEEMSDVFLDQLGMPEPDSPARCRLRIARAADGARDGARSSRSSRTSDPTS